jgi:hypothetical protein
VRFQQERGLGIALLLFEYLLYVMEPFHIEFNFRDTIYTAEVINTHNIYRVSPDDDLLAELFGETLMIEANGDFAWQNLGPDHYQYTLSIANALKKHLGFSE